MNNSNLDASSTTPALTNGSGAAAVLAAGVGAFALAVLAGVGDKSAHVASSLIFYQPTGPLSGVTTSAILIWLFTWGILEWRWRNRTVPAGRINTVALILLGLSFLLTFPPIVDLL
jgi:cyclic lactone autoinducer peptide